MYSLCGHCSARQGGGEFEDAKPGECFVCAGMMDMVEPISKKAAREARSYEFDTFAVGVTLPDGVQEREDEVRADLKLKGNETVRTQAGRMVAGLVAEALGRRIDKQRPDLTLLADFDRGSVSASSRPLYYSARYSKPPGVSQRRELCAKCRGTGCKRCRGTGTEPKPSVEDLVGRRLAKETKSEKATFTWLGSEDRESRVYAPGRPFVVEVKSPKRRKVPRRLVARFRGGQVEVSGGRVLPAKPVKLPTFKFRTTIYGLTRTKVGEEGLADLRKAFRDAPVLFERPYDRPTTKTVYRTSARTKGRSILIDAELDGGLPVKRFVSGDLVSPSVSEVLKTEVRCRNFDIREVRETGEFEFAEVPRIKKKN
ncbi:MAG TPA: hypothetical protein VEB67_03860 [Nitrososphaerales archaeon]|nr:hypothetical protein [Nitrososphaerales archaeon]